MMNICSMFYKFYKLHKPTCVKVKKSWNSPWCLVYHTPQKPLVIRRTYHIIPTFFIPEFDGDFLCKDDLLYEVECVCETMLNDFKELARNQSRRLNIKEATKCVNKEVVQLFVKLLDMYIANNGNKIIEEDVYFDMNQFSTPFVDMTVFVPTNEDCVKNLHNNLENQTHLAKLLRKHMLDKIKMIAQKQSSQLDVNKATEWVNNKAAEIISKLCNMQYADVDAVSFDAPFDMDSFSMDQL